MQSTAKDATDETLVPGASEKKGRWWPWILALVVLALGSLWFFTSQRAAAAAAKPPAQRATPVVVASAKSGDVPVYLRGLGSVTPFKTATIRSRVDGQLMSVAFVEGQLVHEGEVLAQIDPRPYLVQLEQAQGQLAKDEAALKDAQINVDRYQDLFNDQILPKQTLDSQRAAADQFAGLIKADQAQIDSAKLQLTYAQITSPFAGRVGLRLVDPGNIVHATDVSGLLVLTQLQPIAVIFSLPQDDLGQVLSKIRSTATLPVEAWDRDNAKKVGQGTLLTVDNQIDPTTGTYKLKAVFDNKDEQLFPNQFVNIRLLLDTRKGLVVVPAASVQKGPTGSFLFVVKGAKAAVKNVTVALTEGLDAGLSSGVEPGESVVVDGQDKLQDGSAVDVQTRSAASGSPSPAQAVPGGSATGKAQ
jgi:multidrug efflux system membrane fusion protein